MSIHYNPDGSVTEGYKLESNGTFIAHEIGVVITSSAQLANVAANKALGAVQVIVQADGNDVRYRLDGTAPTTTVGYVLKNGATLALSMADAAAAKFIATAAAVLNATYTM
jgi:hypothetical protein